MSRSNSLKYLGFAVVAILIGLAVGWFASRPGVKPVATHEADPAETSTSNPSQSSPTESAGFFKAPGQPAVENIISEAPRAVLNWEDSITDILANNLADTDEKAMQLLDIFTNMPEAGQIEAAQHLSNLVDEDHYPRMGKLLADPKTAPAVSEVLLNDLYNRPSALRLPLLIEVARNPQHPKATEAHEQLTRLLEEDFGQDWQRWQSKSEQWIKANPD